MNDYVIFFGMLLFSLTGFAQDLVYKPKNPAFGGDTFNYQWMIGSAESQNKFKDKQVERNELTELQQFTQDLNAQLLNRYQDLYLRNSLGNDGISVGSYTLVVYPLRFIPSGGLTVDILDTIKNKHK
jgi:curli production assembly/transport component CsgF